MIVLAVINMIWQCLISKEKNSSSQASNIRELGGKRVQLDCLAWSPCIIRVTKRHPIVKGTRILEKEQYLGIVIRREIRSANALR